jgi:hypothetical protein
MGEILATPSWTTAVSDWLPAIQLAGVILLAKYVWETTEIRKRTHQPLLVLDHKLRDAMDQILRRTLGEFDDLNPTTELAEKLLVRNIGVGPAYKVVYKFEGIERIGIWRSDTPYLKPDQAIEVPISKSFVNRGDIKFEATYSSLAGVRFQSRLALRDGVLGLFTLRRFGIVRRSYAFLKKWLVEAPRRKFARRRMVKRIKSAYPEGPPTP